MVSTAYGDELPHSTRSLCPECKRLLDATVYEEGGIILIKKECPEHGVYVEKYWESSDMYNFARKHISPPVSVQTPNVDNSGANCPFDCGLCSRHKSHTMLANIVATNRCDLSCWYCFFYAKEGQPIYEPTLDQIRDMVRKLVAERPVPCNAVQITGGEPTLREDLVEMIKIIKEEGIDHVQVNTDAINYAFKPDLVRQIREAGTNTTYMSFDGMTPKTNPKNHWEVPYALENCMAVGMGVVLVPTVIKGLNDDQVGSIVNFALNYNETTIRGVNFQPVSLVGRMPKKEREAQRITIPKVISDLEEQTNGVLQKDDFFPVPCVNPISKLVEQLKGRRTYNLSTHFACGMATYLVKGEDNKVVPMPQFVDVEGFFEYLDEKADELRAGKNKKWVSLKILKKLSGFVEADRQPKGFNFNKLMFNAIVKRNYRALGDIMHKSLFVGMMHFQDPYNYDVERVERCGIHYAMPDGRIIPFCTFNVIPEIYRDKVQGMYSIPQKEWEEKAGQTLLEAKYKRDVKVLESGDAYKRIYGNLHNYFKND